MKKKTILLAQIIAVILLAWFEADQAFGRGGRDRPGASLVWRELIQRKIGLTLQ